MEPTDSEATEPAPAPGSAVEPAPPPGESQEEPEWREAADLEELEDLLRGGMRQNGGQIRITGDLLLPAGETCMIWPSPPEGTPLVVDLGEHTLTVEGRLIVRTGIELTGAGGEAGLIRVRPGGSATLIGVLFTAAEPGGCAVWQEEGGILKYTPHEDTVGEIRLAPKPEAEAATFGSLMALLEDGKFLETGGLVRATADLTVPADTECTIRPRNPESAPLAVDLGEHMLLVEGGLTVHSGVEFTGAGGETGLVRVRTGGHAGFASSTRFTVTAEGSYALWQEEDGILECEPLPGAAGNIHFAQRPVAAPHSAVSSALFTPVAQVRDGQPLADALPVTDSVRLYRDGAVDMDAQIPVAWDLEPYRAQLDGRERVLITGGYPDADAFQAPVCLVTFQNGNPATILNCSGAEGLPRPSAMVQLALARPELGCRFEWSQDGQTRLPAGAEESPAEGGFPVFCVTFLQKEPPAYPYYLSAVVEDPEVGVGYSDMVVIEAADTQCGSDGNRGGGTDIIDDPMAPEPEPPPAAPDQDESDSEPDGTGSTAPPDHGGGGAETPIPQPGSDRDRAQNPKPSPDPELLPDSPSGTQGGELVPRPALPASDTESAPDAAPPAPTPEPPVAGAAPSGPPGAELEPLPGAQPRINLPGKA